ncbi:MAG: DUF3857 and transglutaminase domain-containing protein [Pyrinomonadaceae bacterium]|nr:DUF3857 and transglutaminase domain-containing protein [Pyrinomonadaceae bacterium]MBP6211476.1 DUF3857 and transglutaminase domain-containing protein [Pyrinomonadaceae bacterium]
MNSNPVRLLTSAFLLLCAFFVLPAAALLPAEEWRPVTPAELQLPASSVEPGADAEVIFWEVRVDDSSTGMVMKHYIRVKIFTEKGREKYSKIDIPFRKGIRIKDIMARVIKADGSIVDLAKADVFDREVAKKDKISFRAKSFAVPNIAPGVIVEYKYQEVYEFGSANNMRMKFQHDVPIQNISYYFKPYLDARYLTFNMSDNKFEKDKGGFYRATLTNVPAIKDEPQMPPVDEIRSWLLLYYTDDKKATVDDFWARAGGYIVKTYDVKDTLKPGKDLKAAATEITAGATTPDEQMAKLFEFCKTKIKNISYDPTLTEDQKDEIKPNKSTSDTYKKMQGTVIDINELFASLATSLGFETRLAFGGDRSEKFFNPTQAHTSFIHFSAVAVKVGDTWKYYSPGDKFVPYGLLDWKEEDTSVLLLGYKDYTKRETPFSKPEQTVAKRSGKFKLSEDGTLEGTVKIEYTGHLANNFKKANYKDSDSKREETLKEMVKENMSTAEISAISIQNMTEPEKPLIYEYKIRVPNYAQKTGKRMFLQPGVFEYGASPVFASATRKYDIFFRHPWSESDDIEIEFPKGFALDSADAPAIIADSGKISSLKIDIAVDKTNGLVKYTRNFFFGGGGNVLFAVQSYPQLKNLFDSFNKADIHTITLKQN